MRAHKLGLFLILSILFSSIAISNAADARNLENATSPANISEQSASTNQPANTITGKLKVAGHRITATELQNLKSEIGISEEDQNYNQLVNGHGTGLRAPTADEWQGLSENLQVAESVDYPSSPSSVDNSQLLWFPPIGNQGAEGSCVAWSVGYYIKTFQEAKEHGWDLSGATWTGGYSGAPTVSYQNKIMSPEFVYHLINNGVDNGASFQDAINLVCSIGVSSWQKMAYSYSDHTTWPSEQAWVEAPFYRGNSSGYQSLNLDTDGDLNSLKNWLAAGNLATIAVDANQYSSFNTTTDLWTVNNYVNPDVNHANTVVGYDDSISYSEDGTIHSGAFKVANSWGKGGWERTSDGFYWISYEAMKQRVGDTSNAMFYYDLINYQPDLTASFSLDHAKRGECQITIGVGSTGSPVRTKSFTQFINGGNVPFPNNSMVLDITEFKNYLQTPYNQTYFLKVYDSGSSPTVGTVTSFAIGNVSSSDAPKPTVNTQNVYLSLIYAVITPEISLSPTSGPAEAALTISGVSFTHSSSVNISYMNPFTSQWISIINNTATSPTGQFAHELNAPDIVLANPAGDNTPISDDIIFRAKDNSNGFACNTTVPYSEWRRGLTRVGDAEAAGLYGNNTDLASTVHVNAGQSLAVAGKWFIPGVVNVLWDGTTDLADTTANATGFFNATVTIPAANAGQHNLVIMDNASKLVVTVTYMPFTVNDYDGLWHGSDFTINLTPDPANSETYYRINGGTILNVNVNGQPRITREGSDNTLEYWSVDAFGNEETPHKTLTNIKLDKTSPTGFIQINSGATYTTSVSVTLTLTASDTLSGVYRVSFSNDGVWDTEQWEASSTSKSWILTNGDGEKTVYYQIKDNVGTTSSFSDSITLDTTCPSVNAGQNITATTGALVTFDASGTTDNVAIASYQWDFGDGANGTGATTTHSYSNSGAYTARLIVQDAAGNTATSNTEVTVQADVIPEFSSLLSLSFIMLASLFSVILGKKARGSRVKLS